MRIVIPSRVMPGRSIRTQRQSLYIERQFGSVFGGLTHFRPSGVPNTQPLSACRDQ
jgi:hypothetical protein